MELSVQLYLALLALVAAGRLIELRHSRRNQERLIAAVQEQLNNILKHAKANNIKVMVEASDENIRVLVTDDGRGFEINGKKNGIGLSNMANRVESFNGTIHIQSSPGNGCSIDINVPCKAGIVTR